MTSICQLIVWFPSTVWSARMATEISAGDCDCASAAGATKTSMSPTNLRIIFSLHPHRAAELRRRRVRVGVFGVLLDGIRPEEAEEIVAGHGRRDPLSAPVAERGEADVALRRVEAQRAEIVLAVAVAAGVRSVAGV